VFGLQRVLDANEAGRPDCRRERRTP
jgi:hypothetical protein